MKPKNTGETTAGNQSVAKALRILQVFTQENPYLRLKDISALAGINQATASRLLTTLKEQGFTASAPYNGEQWGIGAEGAVCIKEGNRVHIEHRLGESASRAATVFQRLVNAGKRLLRVIEHNEGGANKDLAKFADQINALCDKWDR